MINIGPTSDGIIVPIFEERLRQLGSWLKMNGEAIYETKPWKYQNDTTNPDVWYTSKKDVVYATLLKYPKTNIVELSSPKTTEKTTVEILGYPDKIQWVNKNTLLIDLSNFHRSLEPSEWALTFKLTNLDSS